MAEPNRLDHWRRPGNDFNRVLLKCAALLVGVSMTLAVAHAAAGENKLITIKGSTSMEHLIRSLSEDYMKQHPDVQVVVRARRKRVGPQGPRSRESRCGNGVSYTAPH